MSEPRLVIPMRACAALLLLAAAAAPLAAQGEVDGVTGPEVARLRARVDSLLAVRDSVQAAVDRQRAARLRLAGADTTALDTQRVGPLTVVSTPAVAAVARRITEAALESYGAIASMPAPPLDSVVFLIEYRKPVESFEAYRLRPRHHRLWLPQWRGEAWRRGIVERQIGTLLAEALPIDVRAWLGREGVRPPGASPPREVYRALATSPSRAARACLDGALAGCRDALGLVHPGARRERWYDTSQLVAWAVEQRAPLVDRADHRGCVAGRTLAACEEYLATHSPPPPLGAAARASFLAHVLEIGGTAAWLRLTGDAPARAEADADHVPAEAAAAGPTLEAFRGGARVLEAGDAETDSLLAGWRDAVLETRPRNAGGLFGSGAATLFWFAALTALAMRSTRWRLG